MLQVRPLSSALQEKAIKELNEVPSRVPDDIQYIRKWLSQQPHIRARTDDQWILSFLRGCKFSLERTKEKLDLFYTMRGFMPAYFSNRDPFLPEIQKVLNAGIFLPLPNVVGEDGARIYLGRFGDLDRSIPFDTLIKTVVMIGDIMMNEDDYSVIGGQQMFADLAGTSLDYLLTVSLTDLKKLEIYAENGYPSRPQALVVINSSPLYETIINLARSMMSEKIKKRLHVFGTNNTKDVFKIIPRSHLPVEYGGEGGTIAELTAYWKKKVEDNRDYLMADEQYRVDETKRPGKPKTAEEMFGVAGSFRKLDFD